MLFASVMAFSKDPDEVLEFTPDINVACVHTKCIAGNDQSFDQQMRDVVHQVPVLEGSRFALIGIANKVTGFVGFPVEETPFQSCRETCSTPAAQS